jgi:DNA-directed RNA polymerase subunit RPC12/RpoP
MEQEEEISVEAECKNCNHAIRVHTPDCTAIYHDFTEEHICGCKKPQYYGAIVSNKYIGWTEFHCNNCGKLIGFLNSLDENTYEIAQDEAILCINCIRLKK